MKNPLRRVDVPLRTAPARPRKASFVRFATDVLKLKLTDPWRILLSVAIDGVEPWNFSADDRRIVRSLFGDLVGDLEEIPEAARKILVWRLGRGSGKSTIAAALAIFYMVSAPPSWGPGQVPCAVVVAPSKDIAAISVTIARELVRGSELEQLVIQKTDSKESFSLTRPDGRIVTFKAVAASRGGSRLRGFDLLCLIMDESEFFLSNADAADGSGFSVSDRDLMGAAMPRLLGTCLLISTPWPSENVTAEIFEQNHGSPATATAALGASVFMRPDDARLAADVARETERDPENADREYRCVSTAAGSQHIFVEGLNEAIDRERPIVMRAPPGAHVAAGGDLAMERDSSVIAITAQLDGVYTLLETDEIRPSKGAPLAPGYVILERFVPVMRAHGCRSITMDAHYKRSAEEHLATVGFRFVALKSTNEEKYTSYMFLRGLLRSGKLRLPNSPRLIAQMRAVVAVPMPGGGSKITSPRRAGSGGGHGDLVSALVASVWTAKFGAANEAARIRRAFTAHQMSQYAEGTWQQPDAPVFDHSTGNVYPDAQALRWAIQARETQGLSDEAKRDREKNRCVGKEAIAWETKRLGRALTDDEINQLTRRRE